MFKHSAMHLDAVISVHAIRNKYYRLLHNTHHYTFLLVCINALVN